MSMHIQKIQVIETDDHSKKNKKSRKIQITFIGEAPKDIPIYAVQGNSTLSFDINDIEVAKALKRGMQEGIREGRPYKKTISCSTVTISEKKKTTFHSFITHSASLKKFSGGAIGKRSAAATLLLGVGLLLLLNPLAIPAALVTIATGVGITLIALGAVAAASALQKLYKRISTTKEIDALLNKLSNEPDPAPKNTPTANKKTDNSTEHDKGKANTPLNVTAQPKIDATTPNSVVFLPTNTSLNTVNTAKNNLENVNPDPSATAVHTPLQNDLPNSGEHHEVNKNDDHSTDNNSASITPSVNSLQVVTPAVPNLTNLVSSSPSTQTSYTAVIQQTSTTPPTIPITTIISTTTIFETTSIKNASNTNFNNNHVQAVLDEDDEAEMLQYSRLISRIQEEEALQYSCLISRIQQDIPKESQLNNITNNNASDSAVEDPKAIEPNPIYLRVFQELLETEKSYCTQMGALNTSIKIASPQIEALKQKAKEVAERRALDRLPLYEKLTVDPFEPLYAENIQVSNFSKNIKALKEIAVNQTLLEKTTAEMNVGMKYERNDKLLKTLPLEKKDKDIIELYMVAPVQRIVRREMLSKDMREKYECHCKNNQIQPDPAVLNDLRDIETAFDIPPKISNVFTGNNLGISTIPPEVLSAKITGALKRNSMQVTAKNNQDNLPPFILTFRECLDKILEIHTKNVGHAKKKSLQNASEIKKNNVRVANFSAQLSEMYENLANRPLHQENTKEYNELLTLVRRVNNEYEEYNKQNNNSISDKNSISKKLEDLIELLEALASPMTNSNTLSK